jgi:hypothetical protein
MIKSKFNILRDSSGAILLKNNSAKKNILVESPIIILSLINVAILLFHLIDILYDPMPLNSEEAQYWLWSKHLDWSYYSKPPLIAWMNYLSTMVLGDTVIGIRINSLIVGFILPFINYLLAKHLFKDKRIAFWSTIVLFVLPHYNYIYKVFTTDALLLLFWSANMLFCLYAFQRNKLKYWILSGITLGLGIISKYVMILWIPIWLLIAKLQKRNLLKMREFYITLFIASLICLPVLLWNVSQDFVGAKHIFGLAGAYKSHGNWQRSIERVFEFLGGQLLCVSPFFLPALAKLYRSWKNKELGKQHTAVTYLLLPLLFVWGFFLILSIQKNEINWTFFAFSSLPILIAYSIVNYFNTKQSMFYIGITALLVFLVMQPKVFDKMGLTALYPPSIDMYSKQAGLDKLGESVTAILDKTDSSPIFIFSDSYQMASSLAFYVNGNPQTYCVNVGRRMNQFDLWPGIEQFENKGYDAIYVTKKPLPAAIVNSADSIRLINTQERIYRSVDVGRKINIYYLKHFNAIAEIDPEQF